MLNRRTFLRGIAITSLTGPLIPAEAVARLLALPETAGASEPNPVSSNIAFATDALAMIDDVARAEGSGLVLRIGVTALPDGGYRKFLDLRPDDAGGNDVRERIGSLVVLIDRDSLRLLRGTTVELPTPDERRTHGARTLSVCSPLLPCMCAKCRGGN